MRFTNYSRYTGHMADAMNLQALLDQLSDFLLNSGFAGGHHVNPWWGEFGGDEDDRSLDALKEALLRALMESGQLTPEMISELRGDAEPDDDVRAQIAELLDRIIQRMVEEGYLNVSEGGQPQMPGGYTEMKGEGKIDEAREASRQVEFSLTGKGIDFLGYRTLRNLLGAMGRSSFGSHETPHLATGVEAEAASRPYEFGDVLNLDIPATLKSALAREGLREDGTLPLEYGDLHVNQAEYRSSCATVLMVDISHSMILYGEDRFTPAKKVALALTHLIRTQFPGDTLKVVLFGDTRGGDPHQPAGARAGGPVPHQHGRGAQARAAPAAGAEQGHAADRDDHGRQAFRRHAAGRPRLQEQHGAGSVRAERDVPGGGGLPQVGDPDQHLHAGARSGAGGVREPGEPGGARQGLLHQHHDARPVHHARLPASENEAGGVGRRPYTIGLFTTFASVIMIRHLRLRNRGAMPTVLRSGPYRFFFYAGDRGEPPHVHVERESNRAKFWLDPVRMQEGGGFSGVELNRISGLVAAHRDQLLGAWNEYFND